MSAQQRKPAKQHWSHLRLATRGLKPIAGTLDEGARSDAINLSKATGMPVSQAAALLADEDDDPWEYLDELERDEDAMLSLPPSELHEAARAGDHTKIFKLLKGGKHRVNDEDVWGATPLYYACAERSKPQAVSTLLQFKANPNACAVDGEPALSMASRGRLVEIMKLLLEHKADPNNCGHASFCALKASITGPPLPDAKPGTVMAERLAAEAAAATSFYPPSITFGESDGEPSMATRAPLPPPAPRQDHVLAAVKVLLEARADVNGRNRGGLYYETPLVLATRTRQLEVAQLLLENGAALVKPPARAATGRAGAKAKKQTIRGAFVLTDAQQAATGALAQTLEEMMEEQARLKTEAEAKEAEHR